MELDSLRRVPKIALGNWVESEEYIDLYKVQNSVQFLLDHPDDVERYKLVYEESKRMRESK